ALPIYPERRRRTRRTRARWRRAAAASWSGPRQVGRERIEIGVADLDFAKRRHHRDAVAHEDFYDVGREIAAILERGRRAALVFHLQRRRAGRVLRATRVARAAPVVEHGGTALDGRTLGLDGRRRAAPRRNRERRLLREHRAHA